MDAVISWVDGYDPNYQAKLNAFCLEQGIPKQQVIEPTRYQQCNEIYFCLLGLKYFAPWINRIYILTNNQKPQALDAFSGTAFGDKIKIIDQNQLLKSFNVTTPVFNSLSAEWLIWHIDGLSDHFLYLNDDFFIIRPVKIEDFVIQDKLVLRGEWKTQTASKIQHRLRHWLNYPIHIDPHRAWQEQSAVLAGFEHQFYLLPHAPFPLRKKTALAYMEKNEWISNLRYPFRHKNHLSSIPLMTHLEIQAKQTVENHQLKTIMINPGHHSVKKIQQRLKKASENPNVAFVCMQSLDQASSSMRQLLLHWLNEHIVEPHDAIHH